MQMNRRVLWRYAYVVKLFQMEQSMGASSANHCHRTMSQQYIIMHLNMSRPESVRATTREEKCQDLEVERVRKV